jgi:hypothetical protein
MRFVMLMYPNIPIDGDWTPSPEAIATMGRYTKEMQDAGILISVDGFHPPSTGTHLSFSNGQHTVSSGAWMDTKYAIGGYWMINVASKEEAINWAKRCPTVGGDFSVELRQVQEMSDFPAEVQAAATAASNS